MTSDPPDHKQNSMYKLHSALSQNSYVSRWKVLGSIEYESADSFQYFRFFNFFTLISSQTQILTRKLSHKMLWESDIWDEQSFIFFHVHDAWNFFSLRKFIFSQKFEPSIFLLKALRASFFTILHHLHTNLISLSYAIFFQFHYWNYSKSENLFG